MIEGATFGIIAAGPAAIIRTHFRDGGGRAARGSASARVPTRQTQPVASAVYVRLGGYLLTRRT
jgi:hypothetical protein